MKDQIPSRDGFTLIELLVCILVVSVLVALTLPALGAVRRRASEARSAADVRSAGTICLAYTADFRDAYPFLGTPGAPSSPIQVMDVALPYSNYFRYASAYWIYTGGEGRASPYLLEPNPDEPNLPSRCKVQMTHAVQAASAYWRGAEPPEDKSLFRGSRTADVRYPSHKGILTHVRAYAYAAPSSTASEGIVRTLHSFADGHASTIIRTADWASQPDFPLRGFGAIPHPVFTTFDGMFGIDDQAI